jgi:hypothetical protein
MAVIGSRQLINDNKKVRMSKSNRIRCYLKSPGATLASRSQGYNACYMDPETDYQQTLDYLYRLVDYSLQRVSATRRRSLT